MSSEQKDFIIQVYITPTVSSTVSWLHINTTFLATVLSHCSVQQVPIFILFCVSIMCCRQVFLFSTLYEAYHFSQGKVKIVHNNTCTKCQVKPVFYKGLL